MTSRASKVTTMTGTISKLETDRTEEVSTYPIVSKYASTFKNSQLVLVVIYYEKRTMM